MTKKLSDKDKKVWQNFLESSEKLENKDKETLDHQNRIGEKVIDLHGFTLEEANQKVSEFIQDCYDKNVIKINIITGKGLRSKNLSSNTTFIGINSAEIKNHEQNKNMLEVTVEFVSEIISHIKDKENKTVSGDPEKIKKVHDIWKFSKDSRSVNPNWVLIDTQA